MSTSAFPPSAPPPSSAVASPLKQAVFSACAKPAFVVMFVILLAAAIGLNGATRFLQLHFRKLPVPLNMPLASMPKQMGPWVQTSIDMPLSPDIEEVLQTDKYIFRSFVDTRIVPASRMAEFEGKDYEQRQKVLAKIQMDYPTAVITLNVTYYTGMVDTVAHIPDRCFIADGFQPTDYNFPSLNVPGVFVDGDGWRLDANGKRVAFPDETSVNKGLSVRFINFEDQDLNRRSLPKNVTYFFQVNGRYNPNPLQVRKSLQNLFEKHGYYTKVELLTLLQDQQKAIAVHTDFLQYSLPELEKCLPDWHAVVTGTAPAAAAVSAPTTNPSAAPATQPASSH